jgi:hypothetical protein
VNVYSCYTLFTVFICADSPCEDICFRLNVSLHWMHLVRGVSTSQVFTKTWNTEERSVLAVMFRSKMTSFHLRWLMHYSEVLLQWVISKSTSSGSNSTLNSSAVLRSVLQDSWRGLTSGVRVWRNGLTWDSGGTLGVAGTFLANMQSVKAPHVGHKAPILNLCKSLRLIALLL